MYRGQFRALGYIGLLLSISALFGCESDNEHFCAKYSYYYRQLTQPGLIPYRDIGDQLRADLVDPKKDPDQAKIALFVLNDIVSEIKPAGVSPKDYCMRSKLWENYF